MAEIVMVFHSDNKVYVMYRDEKKKEAVDRIIQGKELYSGRCG